jgi:opacity protein-like surface antigen
MNKTSFATLSLLALVASSVSATALAQSATQLYNPAGLYIGGGVGTADISNNYYPYGGNGYGSGYGYGYGHDHYQTAWKAIVGIRPVPIIGAELEYIDFGSTNNNQYYYGNYYGGPSAKASAGSAFGLLYLPLPLPFLDVYGKAGAARLHSTEYLFPSVSCPGTSGCSTIREDQWNTDFAYGAGVQWRWGGLGLRVEYERIDTSGPNPDALTFGVIWIF